MKPILFFFLISISTSCFVLKQNPEVLRWEQQVANIEIIRDNFGVPHVYGKTDADAVFGLMYAQCEDDFNRVERNYIWAIGRLAEVEGEKELYSDLRARLFMTQEEAIEEYENSPEWLRKLCNAFADGINYYLFTHPEVTPALITHFEPWMPMYFSEGSIGGDIERVSPAKIKAFYEDKSLSTIETVGDGLIGLADDEPRGSNGFSISGELTESGNAMLLINPHTSFFFRGEVHMVSEEGLNAYGAVTWGQFFIYQGFNEHTGWMHTSTYTDVTDEFVETVTKDSSGWVYKYGSEQRPITEKQVQLKYRAGDEMKEKTFPIYRSHHGPITQSIDGQWTATAMMWEPKEALIQSFTRTKLKDHEEFNEMMKMRTNSSNNTVYADSQGNIAYYHGNFIPRRDTQFDYTQPIDGSDPTTDWQGLHTVDESITVLNPPNGWIQNCNSTPFTSAAEYSPIPENYPVYMSLNRETFRGIHAIKVLQKAGGLTLDKLIKLGYDPFLPAFEALIPGLVKAYDNQKPQDPILKEAIESLRTWDFTTSEESIPMSLAHYYGLHYMKDGNAPDDMSFMELFTYYGHQSPYAERLSIFKSAHTELIDDFGSWNIPWGEINRYQRLNGDIQQNFDDDAPSIPIGMASGRWGALASYGASTYKGSDRIYGTSGNSFVAVVEFGEKVKAKSMLAGGQSGDPESPHFDDQAQRYADVQFKDVAFYRKDVEARAEKSYRPGRKIKE